MGNEKHDYRRSDLYRMWMDESGLEPEPIMRDAINTADTREVLVATEVRIAKRIVALVEYVRRALLRSEASCLEAVNLGRAEQLANSVTKAVRDLSCDTVVQMLDAVQLQALAMEVYLQRAGATISQEHNLARLFSQRSRLRSA